MPAVTLAGALALAGCGGGSDSPGTGGGKSQAQLDCEAEEGTWSESTTPMCTPQSDGTSLTDTVEALVDATDALEDLAAGADADDSALKVAREAYVKSQSAIMLKGVSADVQKYAEMVIAARDGLEDAIEDAEGAQEKVETARDGFAETDSQYVLLTREIEKADKAITAAKALLAPGGGVAALVAQFPETGDKSPAKRADSIGDDVLAALGEDTNDEPTELPSGDLAKNVFASDSTRTASMMTFAQLFAGATTPQAFGNEVVNAISLGEGETEGFDSVPGETPVNGAPIGYTYRGIDGRAACRGESACAAVTDGGKLGKGWYFYPNEDDGYFTTKIDVDGEGKVTTMYSPASFAEWGMWLDLDEDGDLRVNRFVGAGSTENDGITETDITASSAKYSGTATGLSARKTGTDADAPIASGHFLADVDLRATFGDDARLTGDIDNFRAVNEDQGSAHVNSDWKLDLISAADAFDAGIDASSEGTFGAGATGTWGADAYGGSGTKRPTGIVGQFDANFDGDDDGEAAGVFHAIK